jgi:hypothetical protein
MTAATATPVATPANIKQYHEQGYTLIRNLIPRDLCQKIRAELTVIENGDSAWPVDHFQVCDPRYYRCANGKAMPGGIQIPSRTSPEFKSFADHPRLEQAMADLLGGPVARHTDQALIKSRHIKTEQGGRSFFHQDSYYWRIAPNLGCNTWVALDTVGKDAIALAVMPGSHKDWVLQEHEEYFDEPAWCSAVTGQPFKRLRIPLNKIDSSKEVLVPMEPGDALFFTNYTWHRSEPNRTGRSLAAYAIAYKLKQN